MYKMSWVLTGLVIFLCAGLVDIGVAQQISSTYVDASRTDDSGDGASWATAKKTIQAAVDITSLNGTLWVTNGTYAVGGAAALDSTQMNRVCVERSMTLRSVNGPDVTTIVGAPGSNGSNDVDSVRGVYMGTNATLVGFTVSGGYTIPDGTYPVYAAPGAGIYVENGAVVSNCVIRGNSTLSSGGGVYVQLSGLVTHCTIQENHAKRTGGGAELHYGGTMNYCTVSDNSANGGGGASIDGKGTINNSTFYGNEASEGGGIKASGQMVGEVNVNNSLCFDNLAIGTGGGICGDQALIVNCTLVGNEAQDFMYGGFGGVGGGGFGESMMGGSSLYNCIIWNNTAPTNADFYLLSYGESWSQSVVSNVCASSGVANDVDGCITSNPLFVDASARNYQLQAASPCVNAGIHEMQPNPWDPSTKISVTDLSATDLAGNVRINNDTVDIGAYEQSAVLPTYTITTTAGNHGSIVPANPVVYQGFDQEITILPALGYRVDTLVVDGSPITATHRYSFTNVQAEHTLAATFVIDPHTLTVSSGSGGGVYANGAMVSLSADSAEPGTAFSHWTVVPAEYTENLGNATSASTTFTMPLTEAEIFANYAGIVEVQNVSAAQRPGTKLVDISYDLFCGAADPVMVSLAVSNAAASVNASSLSGDVGADISSGTGRSILWDAGADWDGQVADLSLTVLGTAGELATIPAATIQSVDSRNYTLTVDSSLYGEVSKVSRWAAYDIGMAVGAVESTTHPVVKSYKHYYDKSGKSSSYVSASVGTSFKNLQPNMVAIGLARGASDGYANVRIDPEAGTIKAGAISRSRGGPSYWRDSDGDLRAYSIYQGWGWGIGDSEGGMRRLYKVSGTSPVTLTLNIYCAGTFEAEERTSAGYATMSMVTLVKDLDAYFDVLGDEMSWGMVTDLGSDTNAYDWVFGDEDQEIASFLLQQEFSGGVSQEDADRHIAGGGSYQFTANPGDYILIDDWISVTAANKNPMSLEVGMDRAEVDDFNFRSILSSDGGPEGLTEYAYFEGESIGSPIPAIGTHSTYCWMSTVTCSVNSVEGYANAGWTGTGSVPASGTSTTTGAITLSNLNSSIAWQWAFDGYELTVENGSGSGTYANGTLLPIMADAGDFYKWSGDSVDLLEDLYAASTTLRMPATDISLTPVYRPSDVYVDAAMTNDLQDGHGWSTAKQTIQAAVDLVALNGTVWVTNGIYDAGAVQIDDYGISRVHISRAVTVCSVNGADETVIVGESEWGGIRGVSLSNGCSLVGFTIQDGSATNAGGGVLLHDGCVVEECLLIDNTAGVHGGGAYLSEGGSLNKCIVSGNNASESGSGIAMSGGRVNNCLITENGDSDSDQGAGGVYMTGGALVNSTVVANSAHGGVSGAGDVRNSIVWNNSAPNLLITSGAVYTTCADSGVEQDVDGCITADPLFVDAAVGNYQLSGTSPCIDAGDTAVAPAGKDLANSTRVINGVVDMGAYERFLIEIDADLDGVPDWWERRYYGGPTNAPALQLSSNGVDTVYDMFIAGLDPQNPQSKFIARVVSVPGAGPLISWPVSRGRVYSVYWSPNLVTDFTLLRGNIPWTQDSFTDDANGSEWTGFYKIEVQLED